MFLRFISILHKPAVHSFLRLNSIPLYVSVYTTFCSLVHLSAVGHSVCFHFGAGVGVMLPSVYRDLFEFLHSLQLVFGRVS